MESSNGFGMLSAKSWVVTALPGGGRCRQSTSVYAARGDIDAKQRRHQPKDASSAGSADAESLSPRSAEAERKYEARSSGRQAVRRNRNDRPVASRSSAEDWCSP